MPPGARRQRVAAEPHTAFDGAFFMPIPKLHAFQRQLIRDQRLRFSFSFSQPQMRRRSINNAPPTPRRRLAIRQYKMGPQATFSLPQPARRSSTTIAAQPFITPQFGQKIIKR